MRLTENSFSQGDIKAFEPTMKVGVLATVNDAGLPHLTLISSLQAASPTEVIWGQFTEGLSKRHIRCNPKAGFLIMTLDKQVWSGQATFTHTATQGKEYDAYNATPMFRYNAYFGVHTVYYMNLVRHSGRQRLPMGSVIFAALQTLVAKSLTQSPQGSKAMNLWTRRLLSGLNTLKFLSYLDDEGYPLIIPVIQAQAWGTDGLLFSTSAFHDALEEIPAGAPTALLGMALTMEDVLVRGTFRGIRRTAGIRCGIVDIDWVYNSMPPVPGQIYPPVALDAVTDFS